MSSVIPLETESEVVICPACGGGNPHDAVFCGNHECHKALGEFRYVLEELDARHQPKRDRKTGRCGHGVYCHPAIYHYPYGLSGLAFGLYASSPTTILKIAKINLI
jgi:hypothetical protein